jgi:hypothetical protein
VIRGRPGRLEQQDRKVSKAKQALPENKGSKDRLVRKALRATKDRLVRPVFKVRRAIRESKARRVSKAQAAALVYTS